MTGKWTAANKDAVFISLVLCRKRNFGISYLSRDQGGVEVYVSLLSDWDLDAAFVSAAKPFLQLKMDIRPSEDSEWTPYPSVCRVLNLCQNQWILITLFTFKLSNLNFLGGSCRLVQMVVYFPGNMYIFPVCLLFCRVYIASLLGRIIILQTLCIYMLITNPVLNTFLMLSCLPPCTS